MLQEVYPGIFKAEIPLPKNPLKSLNSYIIKDEETNLIIDTGFNHPACAQAMETALRELQIQSYDIFITHMHVDHSGLVNSLAQKNTKVYSSQITSELIKKFKQIEGLISYGDTFLNHGFPDKEMNYMINKLYHKDKYINEDRSIDLTYIKDDDLLTTGKYKFRCIHTPGHTPGHMCLYEPNVKILFSGDHVLMDISPNISFWDGIANPLADYLNSLDKVYPLNVNLLLPSHRNIAINHRQRIDELKQHHKERIEEIFEVLKEGEMNAYQVASRLKWNMKGKEWNSVNFIQKSFATAEIIAHLDYMATRDMCYKKNNNGRFVYRINKDILKIPV